MDHALNINISYHPNVEFHQLVDALKPLLEYHGVDVEAVKQNKGLAPSNYDGIELNQHPDSPNFLHVYTSGDVSESYDNLVAEVAENLTPLCAPTKIELHDHDTAELSDAIRVYWIGDGPDLIQAQRAEAIEQCRYILAEAGLSAAQCDQVAELINGFQVESADQITRPKDA